MSAPFEEQLAAATGSSLHNPEAEISLLGDMLADNTLIDRVSDRLRPAHFGVPVHGAIFARMQDMALGRATVDAITLAPFFREDADWQRLYLLLLIEAWRRPTCSLPDNDALLARLAGLTDEVWATVRPNVMAFWKRDGRSKTWTQKRLKKEADYVRTRSKSQSEKALKRWKAGKSLDATAVQRQSSGNAPTPNIPIPNGIGAAPVRIDPAKALFDTGVALLTAAGVGERQSRALLAKWRKAHGDAWTLEAIASADGKSDPVSWIERRARSGTEALDEAAARRRRTIAEYAAMPGPPSTTTKEPTDA